MALWVEGVGTTEGLALKTGVNMLWVVHVERGSFLQSMLRVYVCETSRTLHAGWEGEWHGLFLFSCISFLRCLGRDRGRRGGATTG